MVPRQRRNELEFAQDSQIARAAEARLRSSPYRPVRSVSCTNEHGVVTLRGRLPSFYQKQLAQETVSHVAGVRQVVNSIEVVSPERY
jgi:osmotically-inducible protein OsmY